MNAHTITIFGHKFAADRLRSVEFVDFYGRAVITVLLRDTDEVFAIGLRTPTSGEWIRPWDHAFAPDESEPPSDRA
jgi:hypothetical protein